MRGFVSLKFKFYIGCILTLLFRLLEEEESQVSLEVTASPAKVSPQQVQQAVITAPGTIQAVKLQTQQPVELKQTKTPTTRDPLLMTTTMGPLQQLMPVDQSEEFLPATEGLESEPEEEEDEEDTVTPRVEESATPVTVIPTSTPVPHPHTELTSVPPPQEHFQMNLFTTIRPLQRQQLEEKVEPEVVVEKPISVEELETSVTMMSTTVVSPSYTEATPVLSLDHQLVSEENQDLEAMYKTIEALLTLEEEELVDGMVMDKQELPQLEITYISNNSNSSKMENLTILTPFLKKPLTTTSTLVSNNNNSLSSLLQSKAKKEGSQPPKKVSKVKKIMSRKRSYLHPHLRPQLPTIGRSKSLANQIKQDRLMKKKEQEKRRKDQEALMMLMDRKPTENASNYSVIQKLEEDMETEGYQLEPYLEQEQNITSTEIFCVFEFENFTVKSTAQKLKQTVIMSCFYIIFVILRIVN